MNFYKKLSHLQVFLEDFDHKPRTGFRETLIFVKQILLTVLHNFQKAALYFFDRFGKLN